MQYIIVVTSNERRMWWNWAEHELVTDMEKASRFDTLTHVNEQIEKVKERFPNYFVQRKTVWE